MRDLETKESVTLVTEANFEVEVLGSEVPMLVDFWAEWCGPCKAIAPTVKALADEYAGKLRVGKLNVDENPSAPAKYGIRGIPALLLFKEGQVVEQVVGVRPKADLKAVIDRALSSGTPHKG